MDQGVLDSMKKAKIQVELKKLDENFFVSIATIGGFAIDGILDKVVDAPEILTVVGKIPYLSEFLNSLYDCQYKSFFAAFAGLTEQIKLDRYLHPHFRYYMREITTVSQFLESYKSVTIEAGSRNCRVSLIFKHRLFWILKVV
ncbi:hypothetical protein ACLB2K_043986 [Fragaria x ananassa]